MKIICIGNYPPRKCGIATFTENLVNSVILAAKNNPVEIEVIAMNDKGKAYDYPPIVKHSISDQNKNEYLKMADYINQVNADICLVQHEYGIFGGGSGLLLLSLLRNIKIPIVTTLHTILENPSFQQKEVLKKIAQYSTRIVVMSSLAIYLLKKVFNIPENKIVKIEHGVPDFEFFKKQKTKIPKGWTNRKVLFTFGLIGRSKGIETVIKALPEVVAKHPDVLYVVQGKTHPHIIKYSGEEYRNYLENLTNKLKLEQNVVFLNKYLSEEELAQHLLAVDIYISPYLNKTQITSGTLSYAVGGGCAVVSTPYWHAEELLSNELGVLFDFSDSKSLTQRLIELLDDPKYLHLLKDKASKYGINISWPKTGGYYLDVFVKSQMEKLL